MKQQSNTINCPKCGEAINISDILYHQIDEELRKKYEDDLSKEIKKEYSICMLRFRKLQR